MTAPVATRRAVFTVANPQAEPPHAWIHAVAVMLLAHVDREIEAERAAAGRADAGQGDGSQADGDDGREQHGEQIQ